ncbi:hypothetical protein CsSME_00009764 [Camellia sinensis var. sinensis]
MTESKGVAVSASSGGVSVSGSQNLGTMRSSDPRSPGVGTRVRLRPQNGSTNGALCHVQSPLEAPFDFLDYFISKLPSSASNSNFLGPILSSSSEIILNTIRVIDFLGFPPSAIAAAAVLTAVGESVHLPEGGFYERANKEMVRSCHQLMGEYLVDRCPSAGFKHQTVEPPSPLSPVGVLDAAACASCDTHSDNRVSLSGFGSSQAEPPNKRLDRLRRMYSSIVNPFFNLHFAEKRKNKASFCCQSLCR